MIDRKMESDRRAAMNAALIAATIVNANPFRGNARPVSPQDFLPDPAPPSAAREQTLEEQIEILTAIMGCGPGKAN